LRKDVEKGDAKAADVTATQISLISAGITMIEFALRGDLIEDLRSQKAQMANASLPAHAEGSRTDGSKYWIRRERSPQTLIALAEIRKG
jgi:hypothetical protein